jgi:hypothetical protein
MAPNQSKLTIHPWLDAPLYNRIRYPQWKLYLYNAAQKMCTAMDPTGAFALVALQNDWDNHPKNLIPATPATAQNAAVAASIRQRPTFAMPALYNRQATVYDREMYKLDKERFEKLDEAETILHAAIVESLSSGTVRTINTSTPAGIASLSAVQLVGLVHTLFSAPTLQDILTVNADLLRPLLNFEDFPDHITEHINHYESLASFNQPCANISKIQTFQTSIQRWPQFDSVIASWEEQNPNVLTRDFLDFTTYLLTRYYNLPQDVTPRGGNAYSTRKGKGKSKGKGRGKGRGKGKGKGKDTGKGRSLADNDYFEQPTKRPRLHERKAQSVEIAELPDDSEDTIDSDTRSQSSQKSRQSSSSNRTVLRVHGTNTPDTPETSNTNPDPKIYYYCAYHGFNLSHHGHACRVMSNDDSYNSQQRQASLPSDCNPRGNDAVEPQRHSTFLKSWGRYTK